MQGTENQLRESERPIRKPDYPLPMIFSPSKRAELPTRPSSSDALRKQRAHFYRKQTTASGAPIYEFYITESADERREETRRK